MNSVFNIIVGALGISLISTGIDWLRGHYSSVDRKVWGFLFIALGATIVVIAIVV